MPIIRERYPENWGAIAAQVKQDANWRCEDCQRPCQQPREPLTALLKRIQVWRQAHPSPPADFAEAPRRYLLTVAHLDQRPENQARTNLKALCTVCHLRFDARFRAKQKQLKAEFYGQLRIDDLADNGLQLSLLPRQIAPFSLPYQGDAPKEGRAFQQCLKAPSIKALANYRQ
ncbi:MAG: hypothetical protein F6J95_033300 [Leptolyngbya sp. SIO1E4]|nr:hypothetical protein [Leptolyngbya sp. SIO1E4]